MALRRHPALLDATEKNHGLAVFSEGKAAFGASKELG